MYFNENINFNNSIFFTFHLSANNFEPLDRKLDPEDKGGSFYFISRCSAVYFASAKLLEERDPDLSKGFQDFASLLLQFVAVLDVDLRNLSEEEALKRSTKLIIEMTDLYIEDMNANWVKTGSFFDGTYIGDDIQTCNRELDL
jgi:hypothetical protein